MEEQQRQFKGIWIPKEIWLSKDLSFQEKIILVEIDSYDDGEIGCYASNKHFVNNFEITSTRASQIIQSLQRKGYININYDYNGKEIERRYIHINRPPYPENIGMSKNDIGMSKNEMGVCQKVKGGYVKKLKDNNTSINNTINNKKENNKKKKYYENEELNNLFLEFLELRKKIKAVNSERAIKMLINKLSNYNDEIKYKMIEKSIVNSWKDVYELKNIKANNKTLPNWFDKEIPKEEDNGEIEEMLKEFK